MDIYRKYTAKTKEIIDQVPLNKRLKYILDEKSRFISIGNTGIEADRVIQWFDAEIENCEKAKKPPKRKVLTTYKWQSNLEKELTELHNRMNGKYIAEIDFKNFSAVFSGQPIESITIKLVWLLEPVLLAYFIESIRVKILNPKHTNIWSVAKQCFKDADYLKQLRYNYQNSDTGLPKDYNQIDDLLKDLSK